MWKKYKIVKEVGKGTQGKVWQALNIKTGEFVAIKKLKNKKYRTMSECKKVREVKSLGILNNHPNIVKLKAIYGDHDVLHLVLEYMDCSLSQLMKNRKDQPFSEDEVKNWCFQVFQGLAYMHERGYIHRDIKPANLLVSKNVIKIADFGVAREFDDSDDQIPYTGCVGTLWYRAPECLLRFPTYGPAVDIWAMGTIMAELFSFRVLFPGTSEGDQISRICSVIGSPEKNGWVEGVERAKAMNYQFPEISAGDQNLSGLIDSASEEAINLIESLCSWNPCKRPTALEALQHPFFNNCRIQT